MKVQVIRSNRKTIGLEVRADESVILRAPQWLSEKELDEWIGEHAYWIEEKVKQMRQRNLNKKLTGAPAVDEISDVEWKSILREFTERVNHFWMSPLAESPSAIRRQDGGAVAQRAM